MCFISFYVDAFKICREDEGLPVKAILRKDVLNVNGNKIQIRRVYLKFKFLHFYHPKRGGWVLDGDVPICMICQSFFTVFSRRHHCRLCGNIVCSYCSDMEVSIKDCPEVGRVRVCSNCYYFQVQYSITLPLYCLSSIPCCCHTSALDWLSILFI